MPGETDTASPTGLNLTLQVFLTNVAVVFAVVGGLVYSLVALGYDAFYRAFGISPGDVGIDQRRIIAHAAVALALFISMLIAVFAVISAALSWFLQQTTPVVTLWISVAVVAALGPALLGLTKAPILLSRPFIKTTVAVTAGVIVTACITALLHRHAGTPARRRALVLLWVALFAFSYDAMVQFANRRMVELARQVIAGNPIPAGARTLTFDVHADPVCIRDKNAVFYAFYLGEKGDWAAYYLPSRQRTVRTSKDGLELTFIPSAVRPTGPCV
ncbi:hypothetical protein [Paractinoplanes lichenicola]|uniref:Uncharacterized protein n=1 Tax=Paractinoplanes lichenicola TaxID=2802976 RepID=A0ABS1VMD1_9ACTN|nr:hypothetical protein [Actinoplanes lichenicola]MBL7255893.1 hypothetical protein [Actinoplanes lichenicola]